MRRGVIVGISTVASLVTLAAAPMLFAPSAGAAPGDFTAFPDPGGNVDTPDGITVGPDGNLWFTNRGNDRIGRLTPSGTVTTFTDPGGTGSTDNPVEITAGPDANLWYTNRDNDRIGRITPAGVFTTFADPGGTASTDGPLGIAAGPDGNLWYTSAGNDRIGRITPAGVITTFADPAGRVQFPTDITAGPDGNLWFTSPGTHRIGRITPTGTITTFADPAGTASTHSPDEITAGPDGNLWYTNANNDRIGRITTAGLIRTFADPAGNTPIPEGITAGPDGNVWFANTTRGLGRITPDGAITTFDGGHTTGGITAGRDGNLWFTDDGFQQVWRFELPAPPNDAFLDAQELTSVSGSVAGATGGATMETGEPAHGEATSADGRSVWFRYTPANDGMLTIDTCADDAYDTTLGVYVGDTVDALATIGGNDDECAGQSELTVALTAATTYHIAVAGYLQASGPFTLTWSFLPAFSDVPADHPFIDEIQWMGGQGITTGYPDGTYQPGAAVSRQAMSAFMYRLAGEPGFTAPGAPSFSDVGTDHPFFTEIEWMADEAISTGYEDGTYKPGAAVSRQAMSAFMYRLAGEPGFTAPGAPSFSDVRTDHPFFTEIEWMADEAITNGFADGTYKPAAAVSRQAMSAFMFRLAPFVEHWGEILQHTGGSPLDAAGATYPGLQEFTLMADATGRAFHERILGPSPGMAGLGGYRCVVLNGQTDAYSAAELDSLDRYLTGGGTVVTTAEADNISGGPASQASQNQLLEHLGADIANAGDSWPGGGGFFTTGEILEDPLTEGVETIRLGNFSGISAFGSARGLIFYVPGQTNVAAAQAIGDGTVVALSDMNILSDRSDSGYVVEDNAVLAENLCG